MLNVGTIRALHKFTADRGKEPYTDFGLSGIHIDIPDEEDPADGPVIMAADGFAFGAVELESGTVPTDAQGVWLSTGLAPEPEGYVDLEISVDDNGIEGDGCYLDLKRRTRGLTVGTYRKLTDACWPRWQPFLEAKPEENDLVPGEVPIIPIKVRYLSFIERLFWWQNEDVSTVFQGKGILYFAGERVRCAVVQKTDTQDYENSSLERR